MDAIADHKMHSERYTIRIAAWRRCRNAQPAAARVVAVGTTSLRALEAAAQSGELHAGVRRNRYLHHPGYRFRVVDALITNFHSPNPRC